MNKKKSNAAAQARYRERHPARVRAAKQKYNREHREEIAAWKRQYRKDHAEEMKAYRKRHYRETREACLRRGREWRDKNPQYHQKHTKRWHSNNKSWSHKYYEDHKEDFARRQEEYRRQHPERVKAVARDGQRKRRANKIRLFEDFTIGHESFVREFWANRCAICHLEQSGSRRKLAIDHWLPLSKGYALSIENAVLLCERCNAKKGGKWPWEVFDVRIVRGIEHLLEMQEMMYGANETKRAISN